MSKVIEIVVIGGTGTGKSHVLEMIDKALRAEYGHHVQIASHDLSCERGLGSPGEKPRVSDTIFSLREQGVAASGQSLDKVEALQGVASVYDGFPLESAITNVAQAANVTSGLAVSILQDHLKQLCAIQREKLAAECVVDVAVTGLDGARQATDGCTHVPCSGTWILEKGEKVVRRGM